MRGRRACLSAVLVFSLSGFAFGQECRPQTAAETQAIQRVVAAAHDAIERPLTAGAWAIDKAEDGTTSAIVSHPGPPRPLMTCSGIFHLVLTLRPNTANGKEYYEALQAAYAAAKDAEGMRQASRLAAKGRLEVIVHENTPYLREEFRKPLTKLTVPGVPVAYRYTDRPSNDLDDPHVHTILLIGDWSKFPFDRDKYIPYPFVHPTGSPNIENLEVKLEGEAEVVDAILKQIDWAKLTSALTK